MIRLIKNTFFIFFSSMNLIFANSSIHSSLSSFQQALDSAQEGDIIILKDSVYEDDYTLLIQANGTYDRPIILRAQTKNGVIFTGDVRILMGGSHIFLQGFNFIQGTPSKKEVIKFRKNTDCINCKVFNITFDGYNPQDSTKTVHWIDVRGKYNEIAHCTFLNKKSLGNSIVVGRQTNDPDHHMIHHNFFYNRMAVLRSDGRIRNGQEAIKIGNSGTFRSNSYCSIFNNYFLDWNGEIEIISNKSSGNKYYNNTFENSLGALNLRHGDNCDIYNNYFFGKGKESENSGAIRISGKGHKVYNNYIEETSVGNFIGAIVVMNGEENAPDTAYQVVEDVLIVLNTIINSKKGIRIGISPNLNSVLPPHQAVIENNIFYSTDDAIEQINHPTLSSIKGNLRQDGNWDIIDGQNQNYKVQVDLLELYGTIYRLTSTSPAKDSAIGTDNYNIPKIDVNNGIRKNAIDKGAEEYNASGNHSPYKVSDTTSLIGAKSGGLFHCYKEDLILDNKEILLKDYRTTKRIFAKGGLIDGKDYQFMAEEDVFLLPKFDSQNGLLCIVIATCQN